MIIQDLVVFFQKVEENLQNFNSLFEKLKPRFTLMGSIAEGTRMCISNEMDICMEFEGLEDSPFFIKLGDPYHLYITDSFPDWMRVYFDANDRFLMQTFKLELLKAVNKAISDVLQDNPTQLYAYTRNSDYSLQNCSQCQNNIELPLFKQCKDCRVLTSQTKVGVCLQLAWQNWRNGEIGFTIYTSVDLVPVFQTQPAKLRPFVKGLNVAMLKKDHPEEWYEYLKKYLSTDKILQSLGQEDEAVTRVLLKMMNCQKDNNYLVKGGQHLEIGCEKFHSENLRRAFCQIKVLKQSLGIDTISNYLLKKILAMPEILQLDQESEAGLWQEEMLLMKILSNNHLKTYFDKHIDFDKWGENEKAWRSKIPLRQ